MILRSLLILCSLSLVQAKHAPKAPSKIVKTGCLEDALKYVDSKTTVIIDLDETLVVGKIAGKLTQPNTVDIFNKIKKRSDKTFSITARPPSSCWASYNQLANFGIYFDRFAVKNNHFYCNMLWKIPFPVSCRYCRGIVSVGFASKGKALQEFLKLTGHKPKKLMLIDDLERNIKSMASAAKSLNIPYVGIWYVRHV